MRGHPSGPPTPWRSSPTRPIHEPVLMTETYRYDTEYRETLSLQDGTEVELRLVGPEDGPLLVEGFEHLSRESRYLRFFTARNSLSEREVKYLTQLDGENHVAICATIRDDDDREHGVAVARFVRMKDDPKTADVAITVIDEFQHRGLGTELLNRIAEAARERRVKRLHFDMLSSNEPVRSLVHDFAPNVHEDVLEGVATAEVPLSSRAGNRRP